MRGYGQRFLRFLRFLRGKSITNERDRIKRGLLIVALSILVGALLLVGGLVVTAPKTSNGVALLSPTATSQPIAIPTNIPTPTSTPVPPIPSFSHIFEIVLENTSYSRLIGSSQALYLNSLATRYGLATRFYAVTHPSLPNYFALTAGDLFGVSTDCDPDTATCIQNQPNLADSIELSGRTWVAYFESMPAPCATTRAFPFSRT